MLDACVNVQRAFGPQVAAPSVNAVDLIEIRKLTIDAAAPAEAGLLGET